MNASERILTSISRHGYERAFCGSAVSYLRPYLQTVVKFDTCDGKMFLRLSRIVLNERNKGKNSETGGALSLFLYSLLTIACI